MPERLERSVLLVPGSNWSMIEKAAASATADAVCIDLEDAVAIGEKAASRGNVARAFRELDFGRKIRQFRINGLDTEYAYRDLVEVVEAAGAGIDSVVVPKVSTPADVAFVATLLSQIEMAHGFAQIGIEALIETALGACNVREIAASAPRLEALIYGPGDYAASVRMPLAAIGEADEHDVQYPAHRWHAIMHSIVQAARAYGRRAIDGPFGGLHDGQGFTRACNIACAMGFDGKWCIHPSQIEAVNATFVPPAAEIDWARRVLAEYARATETGHGATTLDGRMIDIASIRLSRTIVERAKLAGLAVE
ncbi:Malyl-CoA lyase [Rhodovulum sp. PH10]|uniref:HpcH/HpaI aldolase/citrate lyase family protein n=1 Tax=Rhodovulum sp. PH10 TaxID=1187851 RepID=UPI00027C2416|nr:CoA ester lyase [Rhodovulum sp. PH10]EJW09417.1 Malyl-CoA lyase [Rhodovulum sp. PH10]